MLQDRSGFLWFGTHVGLNSFDGYEFKVYLEEPGNPHSISSSSILSLANDSMNKDIIWIGTHHGLNKYDKRTYRFTRYLCDESRSNSLSGEEVRVIYTDGLIENENARGEMWGRLRYCHRWLPGYAVLFLGTFKK